MDQQTIEKYRRILAKDPSSKLFAPLAESFLDQGLIEQAEALAKQGIKQHPEYAGGFVVAGRIALAQKNYQAALEYLSQAVGLSPDNILGYQLMADAYLATKNPKEALRAHKMALFLNPLSERSQKVVEKLERLTAVDYEEDVFKIQNLQAVEPKNDQAQGASDLERRLSLADALIVRNDVEAALQLLKQTDIQFPGEVEVQSRLRLLNSEFEESEPIQPLPPRRRLLIDAKLKRLNRILKVIEQVRSEMHFEETR